MWFGSYFIALEQALLFCGNLKLPLTSDLDVYSGHCQSLHRNILNSLTLSLIEVLEEIGQCS